MLSPRAICVSRQLLHVIITVTIANFTALYGNLGENPNRKSSRRDPRAVEGQPPSDLHHLASAAATLTSQMYVLIMSFRTLRYNVVAERGEVVPGHNASFILSTQTKQFTIKVTEKTL